MRRRWLAGVGTVLLLALLGVPAVSARQASAPAFDPATFTVGLQPVATGLDRPVFVAGPGDGSGRLFVVEQPGRIRIVKDGALLPEPFLDLAGVVNAPGNEQGLLSMAFDPGYAQSGEFYVGYTANSGEGSGDNSIARYRVSADNPDRADPSSGEVLLAVPDPYPNHNGGLVLFGPDGNLYAGFGDGGSQGDPHGNGQNPHALLGKILRLDVHGSDGNQRYAIPAGNPFADGANGRPEVWLTGLRNPWRFSFDRQTGDLWIGDVGQNRVEEIDRVPAGAGGENLGWNVLEGNDCYATTPCSTEGMLTPMATYTHDFGCSVTGGYVYRGAAVPALQGVYLFADYCSGLLWGLGEGPDGAWVTSQPMETGLNVSSFGEDAAGELYLTDLNGGVYRVTGGA